MREELVAAIQDNVTWLKRFTRFEYFNAFKEYTEKYAPIYINEVSNLESEDDLQALASGVLDNLESGWAKKRIWKRGDAKYNDKQMLICYLSPMLLGLEKESCCRFAEALQQSWAVRWPKDAYQLATYKEIRRGFRNVIFGLEFKDDLRELEEAQEAAEIKKNNSENK